MLDNGKLQRWLKSNGYALDVRGNGHIRVTCPERGYVGMLAVSPSDPRSVRNDIARLRRNGVPVPR